MRTDHLKLPKDEAAEAKRAASYERKQKWKEQPSNRYTPDELRGMTGEFADCTLHKRRTKVMFID